MLPGSNSFISSRVNNRDSLFFFASAKSSQDFWETVSASSTQAISAGVLKSSSSFITLIVFFLLNFFDSENFVV